MLRLFSILLITELLLAGTNVPPCWNIVSDAFESGNLDQWSKVPSGSPADQPQLAPNLGFQNSTGLAVNVAQSESYIYQSGVMKAEEAYIGFYFNPNDVSIPNTNTSWIPGKSIRIADVKGGAEWHTLVSLYVYEPTNGSYYAFLEWRGESSTHYDYSSGMFPISNGWQKITIGYRVDDFVAVWLNDDFVREVTGVNHGQANGSIIEIGKASSNSSITPGGTILFDNVSLLVPRIDNLYVDAPAGNDTNSGTTAAAALRTIQRAAELAGPGTTVHILPGNYRETVEPAMSGSADESVLYMAEDGTNTVFIRGSEPASSLSWSPLSADTIGLPPTVEPTNIWFANISGWSAPPRFIVEIDGAGNIHRFPRAREPDWFVSNEWKRHEFWWCADGGSAVPTSAVDNADYYTRSTLQLLDKTDDSEPAGIEPGNLATLGNLTGATLIAIDTKQGHYVYRRTITNHNVAAGLITVDKICEHDSGSDNPGLGIYSKYYVEGRPFLLDTPGEWWFDAATSNLYLYPFTAGSPANQNIEMSSRDSGFRIDDVSFIIIDSLSFELFNGSAIYSCNGENSRACSNTVRNTEIRCASYGIYLAHGTSTDTPSENITDGFTIENSKLHHIDNRAINMNTWWDGAPAADLYTRAGIVNTTIRSNEFYEISFNSDSDNAVGLSLQYIYKLTFEHNYIHHVAHNGVQFSRSVIVSDKEYDFTPDEIKTGDILVRKNIFEKTCQLTTDNGGLKFWGDPPDHHVFKNVLISGNISRYNFGWTYASEKRERWTAGQAKGTGGCGFYVDMASGIHFFRNVAYKNGYENFRFAGVWRDGELIVCNNTSANAIYGFNFGGGKFDSHGCVQLSALNNISINNEGYGVLHSDGDNVYSNMTLNHNLYFSNGWSDALYKPGAMAIYLGSMPNEYYQTVAEITAARGWETNGVAGNPSFENYSLAEHERHNDYFPDFHLTVLSSNAIGGGTETLPDSLTNVLAIFGVSDEKVGSSLDIGAYEFVPEPLIFEICHLAFVIYYLRRRRRW